jgi:hypothetical protein
VSLDIYSKQPILTLSREHIIPNFLGGRWADDELIDRRQNSTFGSSIDAALEKTLAPMRVVLGAVSGTGEVPPSIRNVPVGEGRMIDIGSGGIPRSVPNLRFPVDKDEDGQVTQVNPRGEVPDVATLERLTRRIRKNYNIPLSSIEAIGVPARRYEQTVTFNFSFDVEQYRAMLKMACNLFACYHRPIFLRDDFDAVRTLVARGGDTSDHITPNMFQQPLNDSRHSFGPLDHLVHVRGYADSGRVEGLVAIRFR